MTAPRVPLTAERRDLAAAYLGLARSTAGPYRRRWPALRDDLAGAAFLGLTEAAGAYDFARDIGFAAFARRRIAGAVLDVLRNRYPLGWRRERERAGGVRPQVRSLTRGFAGPGRVFGMVPDPPVGADIQDADDLGRRLRPLSGRHREVCRRLAYGETQNEIGRAIGVHHTCIARAVAQCRAILAPEPSLS